MGAVERGTVPTSNTPPKSESAQEPLCTCRSFPCLRGPGAAISDWGLGLAAVLQKRPLQRPGVCAQWGNPPPPPEARGNWALRFTG